ncbi:MAG TPA: hypothetical protein VFM18_24320 [Methanosarcina sp.]|nr:hypothetical protein [Methanosarcina sp.]
MTNLNDLAKKALTSAKPVATPMGETRTKDMEMWQQWKSTGSKRHLGQLIDQLSPLIYHEVQRASGSLPTAALAAEAKKWAVKAVETYDPSKGTTLSTHVMNYLPKVRRMNYKYQNAVRLPENMQLQYHEYNKAVTDLTEQLNREPTSEEIASKLGWSKGLVVKFGERLYSDMIESQSERPAEYTQFNENSILMSYLRQQLTSDELFMLDNIDSMSVKEMCDKMGVNLNRYNYLRRKLTEKIAKIKTEIGL